MKSDRVIKDCNVSNESKAIVEIVEKLGIDGAIIFCKGNIIKYSNFQEDSGEFYKYAKMATDLNKIKRKIKISYEELTNLGLINSISLMNKQLIDMVVKWAENGYELQEECKEEHRTTLREELDITSETKDLSLYYDHIKIIQGKKLIIGNILESKILDSLQVYGIHETDTTKDIYCLKL